MCNVLSELWSQQMESKLPYSFPLLPDLPFGHERWSPNVLEGHRTLTGIYLLAYELTNQEDVDQLRVAFHVDTLTTDAIRILIALGDSEASDETPLPEAWILDAAKLLGDMVAVLRQVAELAKGKYVISLLPQD
jgi:hypothetical protein